MTYAAQPYEQFVDDLLTGLTGGMIREEHRYIGSEEPYSLAYPGANERYIKVFGQQNGVFVNFEGGIDYEYKTDEEALYWKTGGKWPDDQSYFYVNYYLKEGQGRLTDRNPGSVTSILAETFARELAVLSKQMELIYRSGFVDLAEGVSLEHVAALLGLTRKDARYASGEVLFKRSTPAEGDIAIPAGTLVSTDQGQNFETTDKRTLRKGQLAITSAVRAQVEGPAGRIETGAIKIINRPILGIETVTNEKETVFAAAKETDEEFRRRIKGTLERAGKASLNAIKYALIEEIPEVTDTNIQVTEKPGMPGVVEIKFGFESGGDADLVRRIEETIFYSRPAGVRVEHNLSTKTKTQGAVLAEDKQVMNFQEETGYQTQPEQTRTKPKVVHLLPEVLNKMPEGVLKLQIDVFLNLVESNLTVSQKENIQDTVRRIVTGYIEKLPMGADLIYNKLLGLIVQAEDTADADLIIKVEKGIDPTGTQYRSNLATEGRKVKVNDPLRDVYVGLMAEPVYMDIIIYIDVANETVPPGVKQTLEGGMRDIVNEMFLETGRKISTSTVKDKTRKYIDDNKLGVILRAGEPVILDVEYEETGRVLKNTAEAKWEEHHAPVLRNLSIREKGELDG